MNFNARVIPARNPMPPEKSQNTFLRISAATHRHYQLSNENALRIDQESIPSVHLVVLDKHVSLVEHFAEHVKPMSCRHATERERPSPFLF